MRAATFPSVVLLAVASGCGADSATFSSDAGVDAPADARPPCFPLDGPFVVDGGAVSFSGSILPLLQICANTECHGNLAGGLDLSAGHQYTSLVGQAARECSDGRLYVDPGHSERSYFVDKLRGSICHCSGERMPLGGPYLSDADIASIIMWVDEGAPNN
jgi:hypothetical protein